MVLKEHSYICRDALSFLREQPSDSIKLIITSPPYNVGKEYEIATSLEEYLKNLTPILTEICRVLAPDGSVCWEVGNYIDPDTSEVFPLDIYYYERI